MAGVFAIGGPIFVNRVEDDLEKRTVEVLDAAGVGPVDAHFSGQDGELRCVVGGPVDIADDVIEAIENLWGVSSVQIATSCSEPRGDAQLADQQDADATATAEVPITDNTRTDVTTPTTEADVTTPTPDLDLLTDVVASDTQFSTLSSLLSDAGLTEILGGDGPFTLFAPTNAAFEALGPDVTGELARDAELLVAVLSHHVAEGSAVSTELAEGALEMLDGTAITLDLGDGIVITSGDSTAAVTEADLVASNGVVHAIDQVLLPAGLVISGTQDFAAVGAALVDGQIVLTGTVASEGQRAALTAAPGSAIDATNVLDELAVDAAASIADDTADVLGAVIASMTSHLVSGRADVVEATVTVSGVYATESDREAFEAALTPIDSDLVDIDVAPRPVADADAAAALEADLNQLVAGSPILFDPNSTIISDQSAATVDRVAATARRVSGVAIVVEGHTDTDGLASSNQVLSEGRAQSVRNALIARGVADSTLTIVGFGGSDPILDGAGVEDKAASRRVEFVVTATQ